MSMETTNSQITTRMSSNSPRVAVVGASGYGGMQIVRLLLDHPFFRITFLGGDKSAGSKWNELFPFLLLNDDIEINKPDIDLIAKTSDFVVLSLPNGIASSLVPNLLDRNLRIVDLSADYRYRSLEKWASSYAIEARKLSRDDNDLCKEAIYGLPEWNQKHISQGKLIAAPGCFPTASLLALLPFINQGLIDYEGIIIDAKTGTSGGGRIAKEHLLLSEASEGISPYGVIGHRHTTEIEQQLSEVARSTIKVQFTPHLVPMARGLLVTSYARLRDPGLTAEDCTTVLEAIYKDQPFIQILPVGTYPSTKWSRYTNKAFLSVQVDKRTSRIVIMSAIDNLFKGQAAQAIQCLNLMGGYDQQLALPLTSYYP